MKDVNYIMQWRKCCKNENNSNVHHDTDNDRWQWEAITTAIIWTVALTAIVMTTRVFYPWTAVATTLVMAMMEISHRDGNTDKTAAFIYSTGMWILVRDSTMATFFVLRCCCAIAHPLKAHTSLRVATTGISCFIESSDTLPRSSILLRNHAAKGVVGSQVQASVVSSLDTSDVKTCSCFSTALLLQQSQHQ